MENFKHLQYYPPATLYFPTINQQKYYISPKTVNTFEFFAISDGRKRIFTEKDSEKGYGTQKIMDPSRVSYVNLFINGVLQPKNCYEIQEGKLILQTEDIPIKGTPIILQMVKI